MRWIIVISDPTTSPLDLKNNSIKELNQSSATSYNYLFGLFDEIIVCGIIGISGITNLKC